MSANIGRQSQSDVKLRSLTFLAYVWFAKHHKTGYKDHHQGEVMIELQKVNKSYPEKNGGAVALRDCSLSIQSGDFVAIIGTSGSGKTTLLNLIGCLDDDYTGLIKFDGKTLTDMSDAELSALRNDAIGFVFQEFQLLDHISVRENIALPLFFSQSTIGEHDVRLESLARQLDISDKLDQYPMHLSGGQRQRVAIARALIRSPQLLLCDEPTGSLDSKTGARLLEMLKSLNAEGYTIVMITHDLTVANAAKRVIRIEDGQLSEEGGSVERCD